MEKNNWKLAAVMVAKIAIIFLCMFFIIKALNNYNSQKIYDTLTEAFDNVDRDIATNKLSELRGKLLEIETLSHEDISQTLLLDELEKITSPQHFSNSYLKDFTFDVPGTSDVRTICDELISQIDDQIEIIEGRKAGD